MRLGKRVMHNVCLQYIKCVNDLNGQRICNTVNEVPRYSHSYTR